MQRHLNTPREPGRLKLLYARWLVGMGRISPTYLDAGNRRRVTRYFASGAILWRFQAAASRELRASKYPDARC